MEMSGKTRFINTLEGKPTDRVPVFPLLMFISAKHAGISYREFATNGSALAQAQLLMLDKFPMDAITACSDAFRVASDLGGETVFPEEGTPYLAQPLVQTEQDFKSLVIPDPSKGRMADRVKAVREMSNAVSNRCAVLGWVEMPYAEACSVCGMVNFMMLVMENPSLAHEILIFLTKIEIQFALAQIEAGADMIGAGDAAASLISPDMYKEFALPYEQMVCEAIHEAGGRVKLHVCGNTESHLPYMSTAGADLYNVDHMVDFDKALSAYTAAGCCFKGNLDPVTELLQSDPITCEKRCHQLISRAAGSRYMLSPGCEVPRDTPDEILSAFCQSSKTYNISAIEESVT